jgi:galactokinase
VSEQVFRAPGRVNLIGDHTDYNEGFVLPLAIQLECVIRARPHERVRLYSREMGTELDLPADGSANPGATPGWGRYVAGVIGALAARGRPPVGLEGTVGSSVPVGSGLSSSAALEVAVALSLCTVARFELEPLELALACQEAEQAATGVPSGIMDQLAAIFGRKDEALLIDCRSFAVHPVPLPADLGIVVLDTQTPRELEDTAYAERMAACEATAARLGLRSLRDATAEQVADDPRARHVVSENARTLAMAAALTSGDIGALGPLLSASHSSLRDDYEVSTRELDVAAVALESAGAYGARLTGAGFGGCVVALTPRSQAQRIANEAASDYRAATGFEPTTYVVRAVAGAGRT